MSNLIFSESLSSIAVKILSNACQILSNPVKRLSNPVKRLSNPVKSCQCVKFSYGLPRAPSSNVNGSNPSKILKALWPFTAVGLLNPHFLSLRAQITSSELGPTIYHKGHPFLAPFWRCSPTRGSSVNSAPIQR